MTAAEIVPWACQDQRAVGLPDETSPLILYDPILGEQLGTDCYVPVRVIRMQPGMNGETMKTVWELIFRFKDAWKELAK